MLKCLENALNYLSYIISFCDLLCAPNSALEGVVVAGKNTCRTTLEKKPITNIFLWIIWLLQDQLWATDKGTESESLCRLVLITVLLLFWPAVHQFSYNVAVYQSLAKHPVKLELLTFWFKYNALKQCLVLRTSSLALHIFELFYWFTIFKIKLEGNE